VSRGMGFLEWIWISFPVSDVPHSHEETPYGHRLSRAPVLRSILIPENEVSTSGS